MWGGVPAWRAVVVGDAGGLMADAVALAGGRVIATLRPDEPLVADDAVLVLDTSGADWPEDALADAAALADIVCCDMRQLDAIADAVLFTDAQLLCEPAMTERVAALAMAAAWRATPDAVREGEGERLHRFSAEVARLADTLARLAAAEAPDEVADRRPLYAVETTPAPVDAAAIRRAIRARRLRDGLFDGGLFEDPAWDMLLDLFAAELEGGRVSVSSLCIAAHVAPTTALRWVGRLVEAGLLERRPDPHDRRRAFMALSPRGSAAMRGYVAALARNGLTLG